MNVEIRRYASVGSTMDEAASAAAAGAPEGVVVVADTQTAGRGRQGRAWISPEGAGLYLSLVLRPRRVDILPLITLAAGVALREGLAEATGLAPDIKWPNDLLVGRRKLGGILAEGHGLGSVGAAVVLGVGVNITNAAFPPDVAAIATSVQSELGRVVDRDDLLDAVLRAVGARYHDLCEGRTGDILRGWREAAPGACGARVEWDTPQGIRSGVTAGIDATGALLVNVSGGVERIVAGEVRMRW